MWSSLCATCYRLCSRAWTTPPFTNESELFLERKHVMLKVIAFYLPQFHSIPLNDQVWGKGFTEWNSVKSAKPLFAQHDQPRVPENNNYYNLLDEETILWQTRLAKQNNVYGFCIYHYWFSGTLLLNKPLELLHNSKQIHFPYCICWANESWKNAWTATDKPESFLEQKYGDKLEWKKHFDYLLQFFKDEDYIVENNRPLLVIYRPESIPNLNESLEYWNQLARENGFDGIEYAYQQIEFEQDPASDDSKFTYSIEYQPRYALTDFETEKEERLSVSKKMKRDLKAVIKKNCLKIATKFFKRSTSKFVASHKQRAISKGPKIYSYTSLMEKVIQRHATSEKSVAGMFVGYDDTPRKSRRGMVMQSNPKLFREYLFKQAYNVKYHYQNDYLFMFAWNEWGESGYLEPDEEYGKQYLSVIKDVVDQYEGL